MLPIDSLTKVCRSTTKPTDRLNTNNDQPAKRDVLLFQVYVRPTIRIIFFLSLHSLTDSILVVLVTFLVQGVSQPPQFSIRLDQVRPVHLLTHARQN